jgi:hypothetical protein
MRWWTDIAAFRRVPAPAALLVTALIAGGCAPPAARTSFLRSVDLVAMTDGMAQSFARDPIIATRTPDDPRWVVSVSRVANQTNQIIPEREKWLYLGRLRGMLTRPELSEARSIVWVVPPERWPALSAEGPVVAEPDELRLPPTHLLTATFGSITTTSGAGRTDAYLCSYELLDLDDGRVIWGDGWETKRTVHGVVYD